MAMDFWEAQRKARSHTTLYLFFFILLTVAGATFVEWSLRTFASESYNSPYPLVGPLFLIITFAVAGFEYSMYKSYGGSYVAESVGARLVEPDTNDIKEKQLLNIVEEMA